MSDLTITRDDVRYAYRLLLGREPDDAGLEHHIQHALQNGLAPAAFSAMLMSSEEYCAKQPSPPPVLKGIPFYGITLFPWLGDQLIGENIIALGEYEPHVLPRFLSCLKEGDVVLDVGANIGTFSLTAAKAVGASGQVISIEPIARNVHSLCAGVIGNDFHNVAILPVAASHHFSVVPIIRNSDSSNGIVDVHAQGSAVESYVPTARLDVLLSSIPRIDVIKIDIEGHEPMALPGFESLLVKHLPLLFSEFSPVAIRNHSKVEPEQYLEALFRHTDQIDVLHHNGRVTRCNAAAEILEQWRKVNAKHGLNGEHHLDLMLQVMR